MQFIENDLALGDVELARDIQGNIVRGYRRTRTDLVFIRLPEGGEAKRCFARLLAEFPVTSAVEHEEVHEAATPLTNLFLSATAYRKIDRDAELGTMGAAFRDGARHERVVDRLNDPSPSVWDSQFREGWDVVLLLAHDGATGVDFDAARVGLAADAVAVLHGHALDAHGRPLTVAEAPRYEHFGFRDGISNPLYVSEPSKASPARMACPLSYVLARDPLSERGYGSYFVFRKLRQDLDRFHSALEAHVRTLLARAERVARIQFGDAGQGEGGHVVPGGGGSDYRRAAELARRFRETGDREVLEEIRDFILRRAMGRDRNGYPYTEWDKPLAERASTPADVTNDFDYEGDLQGSLCPMQAHIRKCNPRGLTRNPAELRHSIARRGVPYGVNGDADVGLLFLCAQSDIELQFEHMQRAWVNDDPTPAELALRQRPTPGYDNIVAQRRGTRDDVLYDTVELPATFFGAVSLRGCEYLFAPSLSGLARLAEMDAAQPT